MYFKRPFILRHSVVRRLYCNYLIFISTPFIHTSHHFYAFTHFTHFFLTPNLHRYSSTRNIFLCLMIPKWRFMLSRSFSRLTLINNYYMRALTNHFSVRDLGIFPVWTLPETEINNFNDFTNSFRTTINFTLELSSKQIVFLDTEVFKGPRFIQTHFETS